MKPTTAFGASGAALRIALLCAVCVVQLTGAFYLPGLAPVNFCKKAESSKACKVSADESACVRARVLLTTTTRVVCYRFS